jgi:hypothetical protein
VFFQLSSIEYEEKGWRERGVGGRGFPLFCVGVGISFLASLFYSSPSKSRRRSPEHGSRFVKEGRREGSGQE